MKVLDQALELAKQAAPESVEQKLLQLVELSKKKAERLEAALEETLKQLAEIRYCEWPSIGLGIGLESERLDRIIIEGDLALDASKRKHYEKKK
jgi:hypothetical protein